jgi:hypothetical protein
VTLPKLNLDVFLSRVTELRERINGLHQSAGPELRKLLDTYDFPFSTMNAMLGYGQKLLKDVIAVKELVAKLAEFSKAEHQ